MRTITINSQQVYKGDLILVNYKNSYKNKNNSYLISANEQFPDILLHKRAQIKLKQILDKLNAHEKIIPVSGYRDYDEQMDIFEDCLRQEGVGYTTNFVAMPGHSEHHTGLAIDLAKKDDNIDFICPDFPYNGICQEFREDACEYGFIERYKEGREKITNVAKEPWHFRYVGFPHSKIIEDNDFTLEEYNDFIKEYTKNDRHFFYKANEKEYEIFFVPASGCNNINITLPEDKKCEFSGNNQDGVIVTLW